MEPPVLAIVLISVIGGAALFIGIWFLVTALIRQMAGMTKELDADTGRFLRESSWGSGYVNGARARNCLRVTEYENGWLVQIAWLLGGGKLWMPKSGARIQPDRGGFLSTKCIAIVCGDDHVRLSGGLADFVEQGQASTTGS
jgi:hypothetical protein